MQLEAQRVGPVSLSERIAFIDVLRGMALFGILAANMRAFFAPLDALPHAEYGRKWEPKGHGSDILRMGNGIACATQLGNASRALTASA